MQQVRQQDKPAIRGVHSRGGGVGWRPETYIFKALDELMLSSN